MRRYTITLPGYRPFAYITDISPEDVPAAIAERFRVKTEQVWIENATQTNQTNQPAQTAEVERVKTEQPRAGAEVDCRG